MPHGEKHLKMFCEDFPSGIEVRRSFLIHPVSQPGSPTWLPDHHQEGKTIVVHENSWTQNERSLVIPEHYRSIRVARAASWQDDETQYQNEPVYSAFEETWLVYYLAVLGTRDFIKLYTGDTLQPTSPEAEQQRLRAENRETSRNIFSFLRLVPRNNR